MGRYIRGNVDDTLTVGLLASKDVVGAVFDEVVDGRTYISSLKAVWSMKGVTLTAAAGPIVVGVAHSDYSDAEVEEWIENTGQWNEGDLVAREIGNRKIRQVGVFEDPDSGPTEAVTLNDGKPITTKLGWILVEGQTLRLWAFNSGLAAMAVSSPEVAINGHVNLWPR